jgi:hypothetical protein
MTSEELARWLAERINGGKFDDPQFYTEEQRELWRGHARALMAHVFDEHTNMDGDTQFDWSTM